MRIALPLVALFAVTGCSNPTAKGKLVDGISGKPVAEMRLIATATDAASMTCSAFEAVTNANGEFSFDTLCSGTAYSLKAENENLWLAEVDSIPDGGAEGLEVKAWLAPKGSGMYRLTGDTLQSIRTSADIKSEPIWNSDTEKVQYPATLPKTPVNIAADDYLVLVGEGSVESTKYYPLIKSGERKFGSSKTTIITMDEWAYIGIEFKSDTEFERKEASPADGSVLKKAKDDRSVAWVKGDALPAGRYAVHREGDGRTTVLDFGKAAE
ncbi:MAG: carboxypeptidase regulatory-like domain-containing protein [Alphaproteobacteria bacterium]|nr:carboxypeptidase regulatory-like domain-containing protein [Alphaproteobacteria bacterium]